MSDSPRDSSLDLLKVLATIAVVKLHSGYLAPSGNSWLPFELIHYLCGFAVPIFMMVTGALLLNRKKEVTWGYVLKKALRVIGLMFSWCVLFALVQSVGEHRLVNPVRLLLRSVIQSDVFWHFWYLWALIFLYLLTPLLLRGFRNDHVRRVVTIGLIVLCGISSLSSLYYVLHGGSFLEAKIPQSLRLWIHVTYYWCGGILYRHVKQSGKKMNFHLGYVIFFLFIAIEISLLQYILCVQLIGRHSPENCFSFPIVIVWNCLLFFWGCHLGDSAFARASEAVIGETMGIYIIHPLLIACIKEVGWWNEGYWLVNFIILLVISYGISKIIGKIPIARQLIVL